MQWSKLKERIEERLAPSLGKRVEMRFTTYRIMQDEYGRGWITVDKHEIVEMSDHKFLNQRAYIERGNLSFDDWILAGQPAYAGPRAGTVLHQQGVYGGWEYTTALRKSLSLSLEDMLGSDNGIIRALAILDRRLGKRRLREMAFTADEIPLVRTLYALRCEAEGVSSRLDPATE